MGAIPRAMSSAADSSSRLIFWVGAAVAVAAEADDTR
jgi:hypothetical protein